MVDIFARGTHSGARLNLGARVRQRASSAGGVTAARQWLWWRWNTHKERNTSVSPYGNGAHMDPWERGGCGVCCVMPAPGWQKVTCSLPNAILLESGTWVVMGRGRGGVGGGVGEGGRGGGRGVVVPISVGIGRVTCRRGCVSL